MPALGLFAALIAVSGCGHINPMTPIKFTPSPVLAADEAILVVGYSKTLSPAWNRVVLDGSSAKPLDNFSGGNPTMDIDVSRYAIWRIGKVDIAPHLGIVSVGDGRRAYYPCGTAKIPVVSMSPGDVIYVGDLDYDVNEGRLMIRVSFDIEGAKTVLKAQAPSFADSLKVRPLSFMNSAMSCPSGDVVIPIYLPPMR